MKHGGFYLMEKIISVEDDQLSPKTLQCVFCSVVAKFFFHVRAFYNLHGVGRIWLLVWLFIA